MPDTPETIVTIPVQPVPVIETAKLGVLYHAPLATTLTPGIVQIGAGLLVTAGLLEVNPDIIKIEQITLNGDIVSPDENKSVNLIVDKTTVGLGNVDNTADLDKPVSTATGLALTEKLSIQQNVIEFGKILYIQADGKIGFKTESVEVNKTAFIAVSLNTTTGVLQFTRQNGDIVSVDFPLEELVSDGYYDTTTEEIVLKLANGNEIRFSASELVNIYEGDGDTVVTYVDQETGANKIKVADAVINRLAAAEEGLSQEISDRQGADTLLQQAVALKADKTIAISDFIVSVNNTGTQLTFILKDCSDTPVSKTTKIINLPDAVVSGVLDNTNEKITLTLASGQTIDINLGDLYNVLDALRTDVDVNTNARHTHSNKATLDATQEAFTTALKNKIDSVESGAEVNIIESVEVNGSALIPSNKKISITIPIDTGDLTNNAGFITNSVNNLSNYYLKTETYTQTEINALIGGIKTITVEIVSSLPTASADTYFNTTKIIYLVRNSTSSGNDYYEEYITVRTGAEGSYAYRWEKIGDTQIDLSNYYTKTEVDTLLGGKQATIDATHKLNADLVDDTNSTNKFVTTTEKTQISTNATNIAGLQSSKQNVITSSAKLDADLVDDTNSTNKFVSTAEKNTWNAKQNALTFDNTPTSNSDNPVKSGGVYSALSGKQDVLTFDTTPTNGSTNPITSDGVYDALVLKADKSGAVGSFVLSINSTTYVVTLQAKDVNGNNLGTAQTIDLPLESVVVSGSYDSATQKVILTLKDGSTIDFSVADLISGLQTEITSTNKLSADLVDDTNTTHKFVTASDKTNWDAKVDASDLASYLPLAGGTMTGDLILTSHGVKWDGVSSASSVTGGNGSNVRIRLTNKSGNYYDEYTFTNSFIAPNPRSNTSGATTSNKDLGYYLYDYTMWQDLYLKGKLYDGHPSKSGTTSVSIAEIESKTNKVTSLSNASTDTQYPSAKLLYNQLLAKQNTLVAGTNITIDPTTNTISATGGASITVDSALSTTSENPVQNKVITEAINDLLNKVYPVGAIYMSVNDTTPASFLGGTWEQLEDRFLLGCGNTYTPGFTGGEATHKLTINEMPTHGHKTWSSNSGYSGNTIGPAQGSSQGIGTTEHNSTYTNDYWKHGKTGRWVIGREGGSKPHNNMPPYLVVFMWKRTA